MDQGTYAFLGLVALLAINRLVLTLLGSGVPRGLFWAVQLLNLAASIFLILFGLPGMPPGLRMIDYFIALLFVWHIVENNVRRSKQLRAAQQSVDQALEAKRSRMRQGLKPKPPDEEPPARARRP